MRSKTLSYAWTHSALVALCVGTFGCSFGEKQQRTAEKVPSSEQPASARKATTTTEQGRQTVTAEQFAQKTAIGGQKEVQLSQTALQQSQNAEVKSFAEQMVQEHSALNRQLMQIAQTKGIQLPSTNAFETALIQTRRTPTGRSEPPLTRPEIPDAELDAARKLEKLSGNEFDRAYANEMVKDHEKTIAKFEQASQSLSDPELKRFAAEALPKLLHHAQMARQLAEKVGSNE